MLAALVLGSPALAQATIAVEWSDGLVSVAADASPRAEVLREVARQAEIDVVGIEMVGDDAVTVRLTRVSPLEAVQRLLKDVPVVLVEEPAPDGEMRLASVRLYARGAPGAVTWAGDGQDDSATLDDDRDPLERSDNRGLLVALLQDGDDERADVALEVLEARDPALMIRELLMAAQSDEPAQRMQAIRLLERTGRIDSATAVAALDHALADDDEAIKAFAISALSTRGAAGLEALRRTFRRSSRDVRLMVLEAVSERDGDSALLREALDDLDPLVRQFAASRLSRSDTPGGG